MAKEKANDTTPDTELAPADSNTALANALLTAMERLAPPQQSGISKEDLAEVMESNSEGMRRALKPENARHPDVSAFNPEGERDHPRPQLKRKTFWIGVPLQRDELTKDEIDLFNRIDHPMEARNGTWKAELRNSGTELHITFPNATVDERMDLPSMKVLMHELIGGSRAVDQDSLLARVAELEKKLNTTAA
jgi:hypothetical protein